jgi:hypothetical protein
MRKPPSGLFVSFKATGAIPVGSNGRRDLLIQATLDGGVRRIEYHPTTSVLGQTVRADAMIFDRDDGRFAIDHVGARQPNDPEQDALLHLAFEQKCSGLLEVTDADIRREPQFTSARKVWQYAAMRISVDDRAQIIGALEMEGPVPIRALDGLVDTSRDTGEVVYALACEGSVTLDLRVPLDDRSIVRAGVTIAPRSDYRRYSV